MELSEPERARARFQAVVSSLLAPGRGAQLFAYNSTEARLQVGADTQRGVPVLAQVLLAPGEDAAGLQQRLQPLLDNLWASRIGDENERFYLRIIVVTTPAEASFVDAALRTLAEHAPAAPALQVFQVSSDGKVRSPSALLFSEVGPALREQAKPPLALLPEAEFAARCQQAVGQTRANQGQIRDLALVVQSRRTPITYSLLGLNLGLFALSYLWGGADELATLGRMGAAAPQRILAGEWWRLLTATALHGGLLHILFNSLALWNLGRLLEPLLGSARFLTLYVVAGLCGSLLGAALGSLVHFGSSVGASGAICGLLAACGALGLRPRGDLPDPVAHNLKRMALLNLGITAVISVQPHVDWRAHLGGALAGAALTLCGLVRPTVRPVENGAPARQPAHVLFAALWGGLLLVSIGTALVHGQPWLLTHPEQRQRIALPGTPLSLEVPRSFGSGQPGTSGEGTVTWSFADPLASPAELTVIAAPYTDAGERERIIRTQWQQEIQAANQGGAPFTPRTLTVSGFPALELSRTLPSGKQQLELLSARPKYLVILQLQRPPGVPPRQIPSLEELLKTLQDEPR